MTEIKRLTDDQELRRIHVRDDAIRVCRMNRGPRLRLILRRAGWSR